MNSVIYIIESYNGDKVYIGSTTNLQRRKWEHSSVYKTKKRYYTSFILFEEYGIDSIVYNILETIENQTNLYIRDREKYWINQYPTSVNNNSPLRTEEEHKTQIAFFNEKQKEDYQEKKEEILKKLSELIICDCGDSITRSSMSRHKQRNIHKNKMNKLITKPLSNPTTTPFICHL
jgi:predicted GIY-YIG superfamily endonuclease